MGDTVNTARRIESSGMPGQINLSAATYEQVREFFDCEHRGRVAAKGKGKLGMCLLKAIRPDLTDDGRLPNARFRALYEGRRNNRGLASGATWRLKSAVGLRPRKPSAAAAA